RALVELDHRDDIRQLVAERLGVVLADHGEGVHGAVARRALPFGVRAAYGAEGARVELTVSARGAALDEQLAARRRLPVGRGDVVGPRQRPQPLAVGFPGPAHGSSLPRITVPMHDSQPPEPQASASAQSGTCASPPWPRSCRAASMSRKMPRIPGWHDDSPPPSVVSGSRPPRRRWPSAANGPPSPCLQNPRPSSSTSAVMVKLS